MSNYLFLLENLCVPHALSQPKDHLLGGNAIYFHAERLSA